MEGMYCVSRMSVMRFASHGSRRTTMKPLAPESHRMRVLIQRPSKITSEVLDRKRRLVLRRACAELLQTHPATKAEPHAAPCCTSTQAAAVVDHVGS